MKDQIQPLLICPVCEKRECKEYSQPIDYMVCGRCDTVFVLGKDGTLSILRHAKACVEGDGE